MPAFYMIYEKHLVYILFSKLISEYTMPLTFSALSGPTCGSGYTKEHDVELT